jgi:hypothetical protein
MPYLGALKVAVVVMGLLIVAGTGVIVVTIAKRMTGSSPPAAETTPRPVVIQAPTSPIPATGPPTAFGDVSIPLAPGARIARTHADSGRLVVEIAEAGDATTILVLDLATGERLGSFLLTPVPR